MSTKPKNTFRPSIFSALLFISFNLPGYHADAQIDVRVDHPTALAVLPNTTVAVDPKKGYLLKEIRDKSNSRKQVEQQSCGIDPKQYF